MGEGVLIPLPKPGKRPTAPNFRPVILLNTLRKVFANIVLIRITPAVESYLPESQTAYRKMKSTADNVWEMKIYASACQHYEHTTFDVLSLDMSKAFDSMPRAKLLDVMRNVVDNDEARMIEKHLQCTSLTIRVGEIPSESFSTAMGTPQGDALSPTLFTCYLEAALRSLRSRIPGQVSECTYSDDVNFIGTKDEIDEVEKIAGDALKEYHLIMNEAKTERRTMTSERESTKGMKILGSFINIEEEIAHRKRLAEAAFNKHHHVMTNRSISVRNRVRAYNVFVRPVLLYNCQTWEMTEKHEEKL